MNEFEQAIREYLKTTDSADINKQYVHDVYAEAYKAGMLGNVSEEMLDIALITSEDLGDHFDELREIAPTFVTGKVHRHTLKNGMNIKFAMGDNGEYSLIINEDKGVKYDSLILLVETSYTTRLDNMISKVTEELADKHFLYETYVPFRDTTIEDIKEAYATLEELRHDFKELKELHPTLSWNLKHNITLESGKELEIKYTNKGNYSEVKNVDTGVIYDVNVLNRLGGRK